MKHCILHKWNLQSNIKYREIGIILKNSSMIKKNLISVLVERWCRLRGNLLFYFKSRDHWSEPAGVIVVENCIIEKASDNLASPHEATYGILIIFGNSGK